MSKTINNKDQKGFTIIEVLIVLAIAALILLVVFLAVPGLQRSQRNSGRKSDIGRIITGVNNFVSNNAGVTVATATDCNTAYNDATTLSQFKNATTAWSCTAITGLAADAGAAAATATINSSLGEGLYYYAMPSPAITKVFPKTATPSAKNQVILFPGFLCKAPNGGVYTDATTEIVTTSNVTVTSLAIVYTTETGTANWAYNCVNAG